MQTIAQWRQKLLKGEVSSLELIDETISRIELIDSTIHSYLYVNKDKARFAAAKDMLLLGLAHRGITWLQSLSC